MTPSNPTPRTSWTPRERYLDALACRPVDRPPAWLMRQAGRYLPEYRELRSGHAFLECVHDPKLAAEITLQPMRRFPLDAAIVFSDILIVLEAMGLDVQFPEGGPRIAPTLDDGGLARLRDVDAGAAFAWLGEALVRVRDGLGPDRALIGFAGAPWTLACYAIEGGGSKDFARARSLLATRPQEAQRLLGRLSDVVADLLVLQLRAGADAVQLFDTWGGMLSAEDYRQHVLPHVQRIIQRVKDAGGRVVLFVKDAAHLHDEVFESGADALGFDWREDLRRVAVRAAGRCAVQGNVDPAVLLSTPDAVRRRVVAAHEAVGGATGHVMNLGHGVLPPTPPQNVEVFLEAVAGLGA